jgi:ribosome-associated protein
MTTPVNNSDEKNMTPLRWVEINSEPVELYKILKFEGMVTSGGEAKAVVAAGQVLVNGKVETQKRKKIVGGDTIEFNNEKISIKLAAADVEK